MRILMIGPLPPPYGGVANFIENITRQESLKDINIQIHRVGRREYEINLFKQFFVEVLDLLNFIIKYKFRNIDIVHIHTSSNWSFYRTCIYFFIVKLLSNDKILIHVHGARFDNFHKNSFLISKKLIKYVLSNCDAVVVTSPKWVRLLKNITTCIRPFVVYNGFDSSLFNPMHMKEIRGLIDIPKDKKILLNIANLETYKGHKYLIGAMEIIKKTRDDILVYIIGEGPLKGDLEIDIKNKGLDNIIFLLGGGKSLDEIINLFNVCDIFVLPSLAEGNPTVMFEALGCGKPFIGTRVGGIPDVILSEDYGLLSEPSNSNDLAEKILISLDKKWNYDVIRNYAKEFTWNNISKDMLQIYRSII